MVKEDDMAKITPCLNALIATFADRDDDYFQSMSPMGPDSGSEVAQG